MEQKDTLAYIVYENIKNDILQSRFEKNEKLPSLKELCEQYQVGRNTMRNAMHLLEEFGFIIPTQGSNHVVIYNIDNFAYNHSYRLLILSKSQAMHEIFEILGLIMPLIAIEALAKSSDTDQSDMLSIIETIEKDKNGNPNILLKQLMELYTLAFVNLKNALFLNLFQTMMSFITIPINENDNNLRSSRYIQNKIRVATMHNFKKALNGKVLVLKKMIPIFTSLVDKGGQQFCKKHCSDFHEYEPIRFTWRVDNQQRYLYNKVCVDILSTIRKNDLQTGDRLASIQELANLYEVSKNTIIKSIEELHLYGIVESSNGIGTIVTYDQHMNMQELLKKPQIQNNRIVFCEMLVFMRWVLSSFQKKHLHKIANESLDETRCIIEKDFSIQPILQMICECYNPTMTYIIKQITESFQWQIFTLLLNQQKNHILYTKEIKDEILKALKDGDIEELQEQLLQILHTCEVILCEVNVVKY